MNKFELNIIINSIVNIDLEEVTYQELLEKIKYYQNLIKTEN